MLGGCNFIILCGESSEGLLQKRDQTDANMDAHIDAEIDDFSPKDANPCSVNVHLQHQRSATGWTEFNGMFVMRRASLALK